MKQRILIIGSGAREHALAWKLGQSKTPTDIYIAPGNAGTAECGENVGIEATDVYHLVEYAKRYIDGITIVGPEHPLADGVVDAFEAQGLRVFGPTKNAARLESSKAFSKERMRTLGIPTARSVTCTTPTEVREVIGSGSFNLPVVLKADGLANGKGVKICRSAREARVEIAAVFKAHRALIIEEFLDGPEVSLLALCDGKHYTLFPLVQDHKFANDGDVGLMTGGMGAVTPLPWATDEYTKKLATTFIAPILGARDEHERELNFRGCLFAGLKLTKHGPRVLEYNVRFGDPEAQVLLPILDADVYDLLLACSEGGLPEALDGHVLPTRGCAATIIAAAKGYPEHGSQGAVIHGLDVSAAGTTVFHAGTMRDDRGVVTRGGRILAVTAHGHETLEAARNAAYRRLASLSFKGMWYRKDIGAKTNQLP